MEATIKSEKETTNRKEKKGKPKWGSRILNFLMMGGFMLVLLSYLCNLFHDQHSNRVFAR
jgi:hypothetical protein